MMRRQDGQAVAEFALVMPVLLLLLMGGLYLGMFVLNHMQAHSAAVQGARVGMEKCLESPPQTAEIEQSASAIAPYASVKATCSATHVTVSVEQVFIIRVPGFFRTPKISYTVTYPLLVK